MKYKCLIFAIAVETFALPAQAAFINSAVIAESHGGGLIVSNSFLQLVPGSISGTVGFQNVGALHINFDVQDFPGSPSSFFLGGFPGGAGTGNLVIQNGSDQLWTDFHIHILPQPNAVKFSMASTITAVPPSTTAIDEYNVDIIFNGAPIAPGGSFSFTGIEFIIPFGLGFSAQFTMVMEPTFIPEPSSIYLTLIALVAALIPNPLRLVRLTFSGFMGKCKTFGGKYEIKGCASSASYIYPVRMG